MCVHGCVMPECFGSVSLCAYGLDMLVCVWCKAGHVHVHVCGCKHVTVWACI